MAPIFSAVRAVIFDLDDTLLSYEQSEAAVLTRIFSENGIKMSEEALAHTWRVSWEEWDRLHLSETARPEVAEGFHRLYGEYLVIFFRVLHATYHFSEPMEVLADKFVAYLGEQTPLTAGAECLLRSLAKTHTLAVATNGLAAYQNPRIDALPVAVQHRFISEEMGVVKPSPAFFDEMLKGLGLPPEQCLLIGDSLGSDMVGAIAAGMHTVWLNPNGRDVGTVKPERVIASLDELL